MKIKRLIILAFALLMALSLVSCGDTPDETGDGPVGPVVTGDIEFTSNGDGTCYVSGIGNCTDLDVYIGEYINGYKVTGIEEKAFYRCPA